MAGFPEVKHVTVDGQLYAEIEGERYMLRELNGMHALSADDPKKLITRYVDDEGTRNQMLQEVRDAEAMVTASTGRVQ